MCPPNRRGSWEGATRWLFHFRDVPEIINCRTDILLHYPYCFGVAEPLLNIGAGAETNLSNVFADVVIVNKTAIRDDDVFEFPFFMVIITVWSMFIPCFTFYRFS